MWKYTDPSSRLVLIEPACPTPKKVKPSREEGAPTAFSKLDKNEVEEYRNL